MRESLSAAAHIKADMGCWSALLPWKGVPMAVHCCRAAARCTSSSHCFKAHHQYLQLLCYMQVKMV